MINHQLKRGSVCVGYKGLM